MDRSKTESDRSSTQTLTEDMRNVGRPWRCIWAPDRTLIGPWSDPHRTMGIIMKSNETITKSRKIKPDYYYWMIRNVVKLLRCIWNPDWTLIGSWSDHGNNYEVKSNPLLNNFKTSQVAHRLPSVYEIVSKTLYSTFSKQVKSAIDCQALTK